MIKNYIWKKCPNNAWLKILQVDNTNTNTNTDINNTLPFDKIVNSNDSNLNLSILTHLNEANVLQILENRYNIDNIYTLSGDVLIAINPYKNLNIYNIDNTSIKSTTPHIYGLVLKTIENLNKFNKSQSVLVSGESGAGKTQTTKYIMKYLSSLSSNNDKEHINNKGIESIFLESNPILESGTFILS